MGLDELLSDEPDVHPKSVKATNEKLRNKEVCPSCGSAQVKDGITFDYCKNDSCKTFAFRHPEYTVDLEKIWD